MDIGFAGGPPVDELDAELEARLALVDHLERVDARQREIIAKMRDGRFAETDGADLFGLDEPDFDLAEPFREDRGGHPAGGAAADDRNLADRLVGARQYSLRNVIGLKPFTAMPAPTGKGVPATGEPG